MLKIIFLFIAVIAAQTITAQNIGKQFPPLTGITLEDKEVTIPADTKGKYTLIGMACSKEAEKDLETWLTPAYNKFIAKVKTDIWENTYDVNFYFIPMFTGVNQAAAGTMKKKVKETTDKELLPHVLFYKGEFAKYRDELGFEDRNTPYFFVLDKSGKIVYAASGRYTYDKMEKVEEAIEE